MSYFEDVAIHRVKNPVYGLSLSVYPTAVCGEDLQTGSPIEISVESENLYALKSGIDELLLSIVPCSGRCFVEMTVTKDGQYYDRDEQWCTVDLDEKTVQYGGCI